MIRLLLTLFLAAVVVAPSAGAGVADLPDASFLWNEFCAVQVVDSFAVAASDFGLVALTLNPVTKHFDPRSHLLLSTAPIDLKVISTLALVTSSAGLTYLIDLSDLPQMNLIGVLDIGGQAYDLVVTGDDLYIASGFQGVRHYRLNEHSSPEFVDSSLAGVHCVQVDLSGTDLLVLDDYNAVLRYDLTQTDLDPPTSYLWLPRRAQAFFNLNDTLIIPIVDQPFLYRGVLNDSEGSLLDSTELGLVPEVVFAVDTFLVAVDTDRHVMDVISTVSGNRSLYNIPWSQGLGPDGCTYYEDGVPHLLLTSSLNSLVSFNLETLWFNQEPRVAYSRPGPVTCLSYQNGRLLTGGARHPLETYRVDINSQPVFDTALYGLNSVAQVLPAGDVTLALFNIDNRNMLQAIRLDTNASSIETLSSFDLAGGISSIEYDPFDLVDSLSLAMAVYPHQVSVIGIRNDWTMSRLDNVISVLASENILDLIVDTAHILFTTDAPLIYAYEFLNGPGTLGEWYVNTPGPINHMVVIEEKEAEDRTWWYPRTILGFDSNHMYEIIWGAGGYPVCLDRGSLPVDVKATALSDKYLYTVGEQGVGVIDLTQAGMPMIEHGGFGGHLIAYGDSTLATSDGEAVHLYSFRGAVTAPEPTDDDIVLAPTTNFLKPNYPNPFNPATQIDFELPQASQVEVSVFNLLGRKVTDLLSGPVSAGHHSVEWNGTDNSGRRVASGVYFYRLVTPTVSETRKMILLK